MRARGRARAEEEGARRFALRAFRRHVSRRRGILFRSLFFLTPRLPPLTPAPRTRTRAQAAAAAAAALPSDDPYARDPPPCAALTLHARAPATAEPPLALLTHAWITPAQLFFIRSHHPVPPCALPGAPPHAVRIALAGGAGATGDGHKPAPPSVSFSLEELRTRFRPRTLVVTTQCGGNRRAHMNAHGATSGIAWGGGAISTAAWTGARLVDVLAAAGVSLPADVPDAIDTWHVIFEGADGMRASVPARRALCPTSDVLLAYDMNAGQGSEGTSGGIPPHHGAPLRAIVPGVVGVRSVKWLTSVTLSPEDATGPWQRGMAYKAFAPGVRSLEGINVAALPSVQEQPVTSVISAPAQDAVVPFGEPVVARGYAYAGGGRAITRVDVSADGGATWRDATIVEGGGSSQRPGAAWAWGLWEAVLPLPEEAATRGQAELVVKAVDEGGNVQPEGVAPIWNLRGLNCNAWHRVRVRVAPPAGEEGVDEAEY
jgi:sulfite oxidase